MLEMDPSKRITAREITNHEWFCQVKSSQHTEDNNVGDKSDNINSATSTFTEGSITSIRRESELEAPSNDQDNAIEGQDTFSILFSRVMQKNISKSMRKCNTHQQNKFLSDYY